MDHLVNILPAIRMILSKGKNAGIAKFIEATDDQIQNFKKEYPDHIISMKIEGDEGLQELKKKSSALPTSCFIGLDGQGLVAFSQSKANVDFLTDIYKKWQKGEKLKLSVPDIPVDGRANQKIVIVTGGAMGFGEGIVEEMFSEGANIIIADLNEEKGKTLENQLNKMGRANKAFFVHADVSNPESVENLVAQSVIEFGGLDVMISNAGILRAGGLDEMDPKTFALMTNVNYTGYFYCAKYSSAVMKIQSAYSDKRYFDIIQINSKSGLKGSNKNFAYAGGKFGGIGLTQSFALELMPDRIKVNSICPGNFFDGPLWSDPQNGLFVQYLKAGKVPGAKNIEDVKKFYEKQVPAGRGCRVIDVVRAIYYVMEQEYETGQAVPVTGGQNMLN
ncbi:MAG: SDR family NAD(P)-dependent oxidoreductase [Bacteroidales bacterium]|nr:SDR family NAD(P)-dependent oxidoreductase [Bacteroidales bacterium]